MPYMRKWNAVTNWIAIVAIAAITITMLVLGHEVAAIAAVVTGVGGMILAKFGQASAVIREATRQMQVAKRKLGLAEPRTRTNLWRKKRGRPSRAIRTQSKVGYAKG